MKKLFNEPIFHFLLLGGLLVIIHNLWGSYQGELGRTIIVSSAELDRLSKAWSSTSGREPSAKDRDYIIDQYVKEEVLVREAQRLGLEDEDVIIRRRMAQKMDFIISADAQVENPSDDILRAYHADNKDKFTSNERRSFNHVYLSPERHGDGLERKAQEVLAALKSGVEWQGLGDPFIQKRSYAVVPKVEVSRLFGPEFSTAIFALESGQWSAPIGSAFGLHIVRIEGVDTPVQADFKAVRPQVLEAWTADQQLSRKAEKVNELRSSYRIIVEEW